jgi:4-hydroxy-2-oxoheptanedioate aldolase
MKTIKARLADGEQVNVFAIGRVFHPNVIEMYGVNGGFQGFWIDQEHSGIAMKEIELATMAGRSAGLDSFVRLAPTDYATVMRMFEAGSSGVMAAQIFTPADAEQIVQWIKFAPRGRRGVNNGGYDGRYGNLGQAEFCEKSNRDTFVAIQIETAQAVQFCDEIAAIDGVDHLFIGPADLSMELGVPGQFLHPLCLQAIDRVAAACKRHGKSWGAVTTTPEHAYALLERGCQMMSMTNEVRTINAGIKSVQQTFSRLFPKS